MDADVSPRRMVMIQAEERVAKILDDHDDLTLMVLYKVLHDGRNFRMDSVQGSIDRLSRQLAEKK